ncbi:MAG: acylase [Deltaproteobacteria bacterium]|nr:acylase [Deltaproteobacteria bacterium]
MERTSKYVGLVIALLLAVVTSTGCKDGGGSDNGAPDAGPDDGYQDAGLDASGGNGDGGAEELTNYSAKITWTTYGIPHIEADNLSSLAFGQGYAFASQNICILADQIIKVRSERSYYFGAGEGDTNITTDLGYKALRVYSNAAEGFAQLPDDIQGASKAYVAGYNKYLTDTGVDNLPPDCKGAEWVKPIDAIDLLAYHLSLTLLASGEQLISYMIDATPPTSPKTATVPVLPLDLPDFRDLGFGSNGWGIGKDLSATGRGALLANPHFPANGPLKFHESHLTIPGELNVYGASLYGTPLVLIGFNEHIAWTHTVATSGHFTVYRLTLVDGDPTSYLYDGEPRQMTSETVEIQVLGEDGTHETMSRTFWRTHYGPIINMLPWTDQNAYSIKDANEMNLDFLSNWLAINRAENLEDLKDAFRNYNGIPWVNTMYADDQGNAFYIDATRVPHLSDATIAEFQNDPLSKVMYDTYGIVALDGSKSANEWQGDIGPGLVPFEKAPKLDRADFVANSNDSHWLSNPSEPLEGYSFLYGSEKTARSLRTRMGLTLLNDAGGDDGLFSMEDIRDALLSNRGKLGELVKDDLVERCTATSEILLSGESEPTDLTAACAALDGWDGKVNLDSTGAHVLREFGSYLTDDLFAIPFDPTDPVNTPSDLAPAPSTDNDPVLLALGNAVSGLHLAGIDPAAPLSDIQFTLKNNEKIPIHGGLGSSGVFNVVGYADPSSKRTLLPEMEAAGVLNYETGLHDEGYLINHGTSFAFALEFTDDGPRAEGIITYSQSSDTGSEHFSDQTKHYSSGQLRPILFKNEDIAANTLSTETITAPVETE